MAAWVKRLLCALYFSVTQFLKTTKCMRSLALLLCLSQVIWNKFCNSSSSSLAEVTRFTHAHSWEPWLLSRAEHPSVLAPYVR